MEVNKTLFVYVSSLTSVGLGCKLLGMNWSSTKRANMINIRENNLCASQGNKRNTSEKNNYKITCMKLSRPKDTLEISLSNSHLLVDGHKLTSTIRLVENFLTNQLTNRWKIW